MPGLYLALFILLTACGDLEQSIKNRESIADEMKAREIKFITDDQLLKWTDHKGQQVTRITQKMLNRALIKTQETEPDSTVGASFISKSIADLDTLVKLPILKIDKYAFETAQNTLPDKAKTFMKQYQEGKINLALQSAFLEGDSVLIYTAPIILAGKPEGIWVIHFQKKQLIFELDMKELNQVLNP